MLFNRFVRYLIIALLFLLIGVIVGLGGGVRFLCPKYDQEQITITPQTIMQELADQSFLITKSVILLEEVEIDVDKGSDWSNFWWGHEITASAPVTVDLGIDLNKLSSNDISVNQTNKTITFYLPPAEIYNSSLAGDIEVSTKSGILKKLLDSDDNEDYNLALKELTQQAEKAVKDNDHLLEVAQEDAQKTFEMLLKDLEYTIMVKTISPSKT